MKAANMQVLFQGSEDLFVCSDKSINNLYMYLRLLYT